MKVLSLYIEKWYIVGSVIDGANKTPLSLSNAESRVWLFFWSNSTVNKVSYGLSYKDYALEGKKGYYKDVFDLLPKYKEYSYEKYGDCKAMENIFSDSGIFADIRKGFGENEQVPMYISFSKDIDIVAQKIFIDTLKKNNFDVKEYTLPIEVLSFEYLERRARVNNSRHLLFVNSCNENLVFAICKKDNAKIKIIASKALNGFGIDSRKQAIVEEVLEFLQQATYFLNMEDINDEILYLSQFAEKWLDKVDHSPAYDAPVALGNIHFKKQSGNDIPVTVSSSRINDRTKNIVDQLTSKAIDLLNESTLPTSEISHIVFLGDVFKNKTFEDSVKKKIGLSDDKIITILELELAQVVSIYDVWGEDAFSEEKERFNKEADLKYKKDSRLAVESKIIDLKYNANIAEEEDRIQDAIDLYCKVLKLNPNDEFSITKKDSLVNELKRRGEDDRKVNELIHKAYQCYEAGKYQETITYSEDILCIQQNNKEAKSLKEKAINEITRHQQLETYISKMHSYISDENYHEADAVLKEVDKLNFNDARLKEIREKINKGVTIIKERTKDIIKRFDILFSNKEYKNCLSPCEEIISLGEDSELWTEKKKQVQQLLCNEENFHDNRNLARKSRTDEKWEEVIIYCDKALVIRHDSELQNWKEEAQERKIKDEMGHIQEEYILAFTNKEWDKIKSLYECNDFLKKKASNAKMYSDAIRARKFKDNQADLCPSEPISSASEPISNEPRHIRGPRRKQTEQKPITLLESPEISININRERKRFPFRTARLETHNSSTRNMLEHPEIEQQEVNEKKRKFHSVCKKRLD